jgi:hypothetical protein
MITDSASITLAARQHIATLAGIAVDELAAQLHCDDDAPAWPHSGAIPHLGGIPHIGVLPHPGGTPRLPAGAPS